MSLRSTLNPGTYHGLTKSPPYFEGWYYKFVSADEEHKLAIIPGVILGKDAHAFIQVLNGSDGSTAYHKFPLSDFSVEYPRFSFQIGKNRFNDHEIFLDIQGVEGDLAGQIRLGELEPWPVTLLSPGIMGWYAWVPRMECYHGVLSFDHELQGSLALNGHAMDFSSGHGYIEKDWGQAFPSAWVWFQSNHFGGQAACITASVAIIPWVRRSFRGFIVGLWHADRLYRFATYTGAWIESLEIHDRRVDWVLRDRRHRLVMSAQRVQGGLLLGPTRLDMGKRVPETLNGTIQVRLETIRGEVLFDHQGRNAGLEVVGDLQRLLQG